MQDDGSHGEMKGGAENHGGDAAKVRGQGVSGHAAKAIATALEALALLGLMLTRLSGMVLMVVRVRGRLRGERRREPSVGVAADQRERE